jgi:hypothetical protein
VPELTASWQPDDGGSKLLWLADNRVAITEVDALPMPPGRLNKQVSIRPDLKQSVEVTRPKFAQFSLEWLYGTASVPLLAGRIDQFD